MLLTTMTRKRLVPNLVLILIGLLFIWPMLWLFFASFDAGAPLSVRIPKDFTLDNYRKILSEPMNLRAFLNSFLISFSQSVIVILLSILAAYPLSRFPLKHKGKIMYGMLFLTGLPLTAIMVPVYMVFFSLKINNSLISTTLFLIATALPYSIWMTKNFMDDVPVVLEEAAWIEGAGMLETIRRVILPVIVPGIFVVFIFTFSGSWGNFFVPFILLNSANKFPASVAIYQFFGAFGKIAYGELAAFSLLYTLPIAVFYLLSQKYMSQGFSMSGSVK
ncbi:MAG: multiple sugar transport system permease protein [Sphaerochaeta sp.]|jgi:multiple sugar transport system permease protein|nr:multiple sugar transport system permease protein [Sphaerochaeta sp.]MDN5334090.1 multiple sugar transport system permease protein [Sphaerochaeta sp.]